MNVYVAGVLGLLGVLCLVAGVHGKGTQLFTALTGSSAPAGGSSGAVAGAGAAAAQVGSVVSQLGQAPAAGAAGGTMRAT